LRATVASNEFFCLSCRLTGELDLHGRCATCGSEAVTHPLRYRLNFLEADDCCIREKRVPLKFNLEDYEAGSRGSLFSLSWQEFLMIFRKTSFAFYEEGKRSMKRNSLAILAFVFLSAITAMSQEARSEVSVQATGFFTKDSDGRRISQKTTQSGGILVGYRYRINRWFSAEANYGYNRNTQQYFSSSGAARVQANVNSVTSDVVMNLPFRFHKLLPYVLGGGGALIFKPTNNFGGFVPGADSQAKGAFVYGGGADYGITRRVSLRAEYRGFVYKAPDFGLSNLTTDKWTHTASPSAGLVVRF